jgi:hypothetical protein
MRFPDTPFMKRTFDLAENRGLKVKLIPHIIQMVKPPNTRLFFNNVRINNQDSSVTGDPFNIASYIDDPDLLTPQGVSKKVGEAIQPFRDMFRASPGQRADIAITIDRLFKDTDKLSMRSYMFEGGMNAKGIHWCETIDGATGLYDRSLAESEWLDTVCRFLAITWDHCSRS